jgi:hypothetical protein
MGTAGEGILAGSADSLRISLLVIDDFYLDP